MAGRPPGLGRVLWLPPLSAFVGGGFSAVRWGRGGAEDERAQAGRGQLHGRGFGSQTIRLPFSVSTHTTSAPHVGPLHFGMVHLPVAPPEGVSVSGASSRTSSCGCQNTIPASSHPGGDRAAGHSGTASPCHRFQSETL